MRLTLLIPATICLGLAACADHRGQSSGPGAIQDPSGQLPGDNTVDELNKGGDPEVPSVGDPGSSVPDGGGIVPPEPPSPGFPEGGQPVPEPSTLLLVGTGLAGLAVLRRRRRPHDTV
jgi:hypothetical protein